MPRRYLTLLVLIPGTAAAGPNAGGVLLVHAQADAPYSYDDPAECGHPTPTSCAETRARVDGEGPFLFSILAAFPEGASPRVAGATFGIEYDASIHVLDYQSCGDFELVTENWPASREGIAITWALPETTLVFEMCAFLGYQDGDPGVFSSWVHPTQGAAFVDDSIVNDPESVVAFGSLGFGMDGSVECPAPVGACCEGEDCRFISEADCAGTFLGAGVPCSSGPCRVGACCFPDGSCLETARWECEKGGGSYQGAESACAPGLCMPTPVIDSSWGLLRMVFRRPSP